MINKIKRILEKFLNFLFDFLPQGSLILVAGKDANNHRAYESIITGAGHRYTGRYSLNKRHNLTLWEAPSLIIWDLNANEEADSSPLYSIKIDYGIPVLIFTESRYARDADDVIKSPSLDWLDNSVKIQKPITTEQLIALISTYLYEKTSPLIKDTEL